MIRDLIVNIFRFVLLIFLQLFILNNIQFSGFVNPYLYVLFILLLPFETPGWVLLFSAFFLGLFIDLASVTLGYHTMATVFMAYFRYHLLRYIAPHDGYDGMRPSIQSLGIAWFSKYTVILVLAHHMVLFWIESFSLQDLLPATIRALASSAFTILLVFVCQILTMRPK